MRILFPTNPRHAAAALAITITSATLGLLAFLLAGERISTWGSFIAIGVTAIVTTPFMYQLLVALFGGYKPRQQRAETDTKSGSRPPARKGV